MGGLLAKAVLSLGLVVCALPASQYAQDATLRASAPKEAARITSRDARVVVSTLGRRFEENPEFKPSAGDLANIRAVLSVQPLEPKLLSIIGVGHDVSGHTKHAADVMRVANRVSRRDSISGLYLIENASASGDVRETLRHYNAVLSTQPSLNGVLLPILSSAIVYPEIRTELRSYLKDGTKWTREFLAVVAEKGSATDLEALLLPLPKALSTDEYAPILASVLHRIAIEGDRASALRFAAATIPDFSASYLTDLAPHPATLDKQLGLFAWTFPPDDGIQAEIGDGKSLQVRAEPLARGIVAVRDLLLEAGGRYQLAHSLEYEPGSAQIDARWSADCINSAGTVRFWEQRLPAARAKGTFRSILTVPQGCKAVRITLFAEGPDGQMPSMLKIADLIFSK